jgi:hypothetical protein
MATVDGLVGVTGARADDLVDHLGDEPADELANEVAEERADAGSVVGLSGPDRGAALGPSGWPEISTRSW